MILTKQHLDFWAMKKAPKWAQAIAKPGAVPNIHSLINAQTAGAVKASHDVPNMMSTLRIARGTDERHGKRYASKQYMLDCLKSYALPQYCTTTKRQAATARKWLEKIAKNKAP